MSFFRDIKSFWNTHGLTIIMILSLLFILIAKIKGWGFGKTRKVQYDNIPLRVNIPKKKRKTRESLAREIVERYYNDKFPSVRPDFLKNPLTGRNLECDLFNEKRKLCIEIQGQQHYYFSDHFHKNRKQFEGQQERDKIKAKLLSENGYKLIEIPFSIHSTEIEEYIINKLKEM